MMSACALLLAFVFWCGGAAGTLQFDVNGTALKIATTPVAYNGISLKAPIDGELITPKKLKELYFPSYSNLTSLSKAEFTLATGNRTFFLLCNISASGSALDMSCERSLVNLVALLISAPDSQYPNFPGRNLFYVVWPASYLTPVVELTLRDYGFLHSQMKWGNVSLLNATATPDGRNVWEEMFKSAGWIFYQVFTCVFCLGCVIIGSYNFYHSNWRVKFPQISHMCLLIEIAGNIWRFLWFAIDPLSSHAIFLNIVVSSIFAIVPYGFCMTGSLLVALFWFQILQQNKLPTEQIAEKLKLPTYVLAGILGLLTVAVVVGYLIIPRGSPQIGTLISVITAIYIVIAVFIFAFYCYTGLKIIRFLTGQYSRSVKPDQVCTASEKERLNRIVKLVITSAICMLGLVITNLFFMFPLAYTLPAHIIIWSLDALFLGLLSLIQILGFLPKKFKITKTTSGSRPNTVSSNL